MADELTLPPEENSSSAKSRKELLIFWLRMVGWVATAVVAPITTFSIKFGLFTEYGYQVTTDDLGNVTGMKVALNGWGIVSVVLIAFSVFSVLNEIIDAYAKKYSYAKQILLGLKNKILPIAIAIACCYFLKGMMEQIIFCLTTIGICQIAAIALNPLPEWKSKKKGEEDYSDLISLLPKYIRGKMKKEGIK